MVNHSFLKVYYSLLFTVSGIDITDMKFVLMNQQNVGQRLDSFGKRFAHVRRDKDGVIALIKM